MVLSFLDCEIDIVFPCYTLKGFDVAIRNFNGLCTLSLTDQLFYRDFPMGRLPYASGVSDTSSLRLLYACG